MSVLATHMKILETHSGWITEVGKNTNACSQRFEIHVRVFNSWKEEVDALVASLSRKFSRLNPRVGALQGKMVSVEGKTAALEKRIDALTGRLDKDGVCVINLIQNRLGAVEGEAAALRKNAAIVSRKVDNLSKELANEIAKNALLEKELETQKYKVAHLEKVVLELFAKEEKRKTVNESGQEELTQKVNEHSLQIGDMDKRIDIVAEGSKETRTQLSKRMSNLEEQQTSSIIDSAGRSMQNRKQFRKSLGSPLKALN